jgi:hypothetical protein
MLIMLNTFICTAPTLSEKIREEQKELVVVRVEEWRQEEVFIKFSDHLGFKESGNNPDTINRIGCFGEWQFKESTLHYIGYREVTLKKFRTNPEIFPKEIQREALRTLINVNWTLLHDYQYYVGRVIDDVLITKSGMLAAAHLGGTESVKLFLLSKGRVNNRDINKTTIKKYLKEFQGYDL